MGKKLACASGLVLVLPLATSAIEPPPAAQANPAPPGRVLNLRVRVAPGHAMVFRPHWFADGSSYRSHRQAVDVAPGQTAEVMLGGAGRPVVGRLTRAAGLPYFG